MADLIKFPGKRRQIAMTYELHRFAPDGRICGKVPIQARDDAEAMREARALADGLQGDLWSEGRLVNRFAATDQPIAVSIRLLSDPASGPDR